MTARGTLRGMEPADFALLPADKLRRLSRREYHVLADAGMFENERVELLYGRIVAMSPQKPPHAGRVHALTQLLTRALSGRGDVRVQLPLAASDDSEPEPDLAVVDPGRYDDEHPRTAHLVVEIAHSSRLTDLRLKPPLYAAMGVPEYWVIDLDRDAVVVHREPDADGYRRIETLGRGHRVALAWFPEVTFDVDDLLPHRDPGGGRPARDP